MNDINSAAEQFFKGLHALSARDFSTAERHFLKALRIVPDRPSVLTNLSVVYAEQGRLIEALALAETAVENDPSDPLFMLQVSSVQLKLGRYSESLRSIETVLEMDTTIPQAYNNRGGALKELTRLDEALASYDKAISLKPDYAEAYSNRGIVLKELNRLDEALVSYDKAISLKPEYAEGYSNRGIVLKALKKLDEALASYNKAISLKPNYAEAYSNRGNTLTELKRHDEALASHDTAISLKPNYAEAYSNRGNTLTELNRHDEALASYDTAISLKPDCAEAYSNRGDAWAEIEEWSKAKRDFEAALSISPRIFSAIYGLSILPDGYLTEERTEQLLARVTTVANFEDLPKKLFTKANLLGSLKRWDDSFACLLEANALRKAESHTSVDAWMKRFIQIEATLTAWVPVQSKLDKDQRAKLLVILGNSRSGKTTLERLLCIDPTFFRGYEGCEAGAATSALKRLASTSMGLAEPNCGKAIITSLFPSKAEQITTKDPRVLTITNPFLLPATHLIHDLYADSYFVFLKRDPLDNAAEIFRTDYKERHAFAYCPHAAFEYVKRYNQISDILIDKLGARAIAIGYEEVCYSSDEVVRGVYGHLGIEIPSTRASKGTERKRRDPRSPYREGFAKLISLM